MEPRAIGQWDVEHLPAVIASIWEEAITVFRVGAHRSAVVACGRTLEQAAVERSITGTLPVEIEPSSRVSSPVRRSRTSVSAKRSRSTIQSPDAGRPFHAVGFVAYCGNGANRLRLRRLRCAC